MLSIRNLSIKIKTLVEEEFLLIKMLDKNPEEIRNGKKNLKTNPTNLWTKSFNFEYVLHGLKSES